jgi:hypothetical protein
MSLSKDMAKKMYQSNHPYAQAMYQQISNKAIWNIVLEKYPRLAEFFLTGRGKSELTVLERSLLEFIKQSEFIRPYNDSDYAEREYEHPPWLKPTDPPPIVPPVIPPNDPPPEEPPPPPWEVVCDASHDGCWCSNGAEMEITICATYPIVAVIQTWGHADFVIDSKNADGTCITGRVFGSNLDKGFITWEICMQHENGQCCSNINIYECPEEECCPDDKTPYCSPRNQESIGATDTATLCIEGGVAPFTISIGGDVTWEDGTITDIENSKSRCAKIVSDGSCGIGSVTFTDACNQTVTCTVRIVGGCWCGPSGCQSGYYSGCVAGGSADNACTMQVLGTALCYKYSGEYYQRDDYAQDPGCAGSCNCNDCSACATQSNNVCLSPTGEPYPAWEPGYICCNPICSLDNRGCPPGSDYTSRWCGKQSAGYPNYREWKCPTDCP